MTGSFFRIRSIALYEAKVILRGWLFRVAFLLPLAFLAVIILTSVFRNMFMMSLMVGLFFYPSFFPWIAAIFYTVYACLVLAAVATASGWREWRLDTLEAARVRPYSNAEHAAGKLAGQIAVFLLMTVSVMAAVLGLNIFSTGITVFPGGYLLYPLIVALPAFFFVAGLSMIVSRLARNQMLSLLIVTAMIICGATLAEGHYHILDMTSLRMPLFFSRITGFTLPELIGLQRLLYLASGLALAVLTAAFSVRPPGRRSAPALASAAAVLLIAAAGYAGASYHGYFAAGERMREGIREISDSYRRLPRLEPISYDLDVDQEGRGIDCSARIVLANMSGGLVDRYVFTLNPGLDVAQVRRGSENLHFSRRLHILEVTPPVPLGIEERDTIEVRYAGVPDGRAMFSDVPEEVRRADGSIGDKWGSDLMPALEYFRLPRDLVPLRYDYMLLVPDAMWYPVPSLPYNPGSPGGDRRSFSRFRTRVIPRAGLAAFSQGVRTAWEDGTFTFEPEYPLTGITLAIGRLRTRTIEVDSLEYNLCATPAGEEIAGLLESARDTLPGMIAYFRDKIEYSLGLSYPFGRVTVLEAPVTFAPFNRPLRDTGFGFAQPEIVLVRERGILLGLSNLKGQFDMNRKYRSDRLSLEEQDRFTVLFNLQNALGQFIRDSEVCALPLFFRQATAVSPGRHPHLGLLMEHAAGEKVLSGLRSRHMTEDALTDGERASRAILEGKFLETAMAPEGYQWAGNMAACWARHHYYLIEDRAGKGSLGRFVGELADSRRFEVIEEDDLLDLFERRLGLRLESLLIDLGHPADIPGYIYGDFDCCEFVDGERKRYRFSFDVSNPEKAGGVLVISAALKYPKGVRESMRRTVLPPVVDVQAIGPGEDRRVWFESDYEATTIWINTMISRNIPSRIIWGPGIEVSGSCRGAAARNAPRGVEISDPGAGVIIVDDQDQGFETVGGEKGGLLGRLLGRSGSGVEMVDVRSADITREPPSRWITAIGEGFYGRYVRSARCIGAGDGRAGAVWHARIDRAGEYDVFCYVHDPFRRYMQESRQEKGLDRIEHHFTVRHSGGRSEVSVIPDRCEDGWTLLGRYSFEEGEASVELSDRSPAGFVLADAVKWVRIDRDAAPR